MSSCRSNVCLLKNVATTEQHLHLAPLTFLTATIMVLQCGFQCAPGNHVWDRSPMVCSSVLVRTGTHLRLCETERRLWKSGTSLNWQGQRPDIVNNLETPSPLWVLIHSSSLAYPMGGQRSTQYPQERCFQRQIQTDYFGQ